MTDDEAYAFYANPDNLRAGPRVPKCDAPRRQGPHCRAMAGWGTDHPGVGRCRVHDGRAPGA